MNKTTIEWCHLTWNVTRGCSGAGPDCLNCYAERLAGRFSGPGLAFDGFAERVDGRARWTGKLAVVNTNDKLTEPIRIAQPSRIFVNSTSDLYHNALRDVDIDPIAVVMMLCSWHRHITLTKRVKRMARYWNSPTLYDRLQRLADPLRKRFPKLNQTAIGDPRKRGVPSWIWNGASAGYQGAVDKRLAPLHAMPAGPQVLSLEPLLGPLDLSAALWTRPYDRVPSALTRTQVRWVIVGSESGPGARPAKLKWVRSIRDQCIEADVAFFFKQWVGPTVRGEIEPAPGRPAAKGLMSMPKLDGLVWAEIPRIHATNSSGVEGEVRAAA